MKWNIKNTIKVFFVMAAVLAQVKCSYSNDVVENPPAMTNEVDFGTYTWK